LPSNRFDSFGFLVLFIVSLRARIGVRRANFLHAAQIHFSEIFSCGGRIAREHGRIPDKNPGLIAPLTPGINLAGGFFGGRAGAFADSTKKPSEPGHF
jgi:small ligand-binding sensory domain FIST